MEKIKKALKLKSIDYLKLIIFLIIFNLNFENAVYCLPNNLRVPIMGNSRRAIDAFLDKIGRAHV